MPTKPSELVLSRLSADLPAKEFLKTAAGGGVQVIKDYGRLITTDFTEFAEHVMGPQGFIRIGMPKVDVNDKAVREELLMLHRVGLWATHGLNVFSLSEQLTAGLMLTDPPPLEDKKLHLPFPVFCIRVPPGLLPVFEGEKQRWANMIWVQDYYSLEKSVNGPAHFFRWMVCGHGLTLWRDRNGDDVLADDKDGSLIQVYEDDPAEVPQDSITLDYGLRIIRNLVAWLDSTGGMTKQTHSTRPPQPRGTPKDPSVPTVWLIGNEVKIPREVVRMAPEIALGRSKHPTPGWHVRTRFVVRGHWRNQAHGEGRQMRTKKWISPFWKGPEGTAAWSHLYVDKEKP